MVIKPKNPDELAAFLKSNPLILYGMGTVGMRIAEWCEEYGIPFLISDKNVSKEESGRFVMPNRIPVDYADAKVVVSSVAYNNEIKRDLLTLGVAEKQIIDCSVFMPEEITWTELEDNNCADFEAMRKKAEMLIAWGWIPERIDSVADYGCGYRFIEKKLPCNTQYYPIDYVDRGKGTIVCDFNKKEYPDVDTELSICIGVLMYINPAHDLVEHICKHTKKRILFSFVTLEGIADVGIRRKSGIVQHFTEKQIVDMFLEHGFKLQDRKEESRGKTEVTFFLFEK